MYKETLIQKLGNIKILADECLEALDQLAKDSSTTAPIADVRRASAKDIALQIANKAKDCDESEVIQKQVLDKHNREGKILLCFYISYKYFSNEWLITGDVEKITSELGVKIDARNATNCLKGASNNRTKKQRFHADDV